MTAGHRPLLEALAMCVALIVGCVACYSVAVFLAGCAPMREADDPIVAAYSAELLACVRRAKTRDESRACRADVEARYATLRDAGAAPGDGSP
jgi:hypothetical protein